MISKRKRRIIFAWCIRIGVAIVSVITFFALMYTPVLSVRGTIVTSNTDAVVIFAEEQMEEILSKKSFVIVPNRSRYLFFHKKIEDSIKQHKLVKDVSVSWAVFNFLHINIKEHTPFGFFCLNNNKSYKGDCSVLNKEGEIFVTGLELDYSEDDIIHFVHKNPKEKGFLEKEHFDIMSQSIDLLSKRKERVTQVVAELYGTQSVIITLHTEGGTQIHINPHKESTLFVLDKALVFINEKEKGGLAAVEKIHLYDPSRIAYWRKG